ncbi:hypothetical protein BJ165DRAFT_632881 [Panaeolus papilionaceus]|nr:hypothetical protein BJ165DRAFT_632881 [Panaeolus papilionaceus]
MDNTQILTFNTAADKGPLTSIIFLHTTYYKWSDATFEFLFSRNAHRPSRLTIDDRDPQVSYSGAWTVGTGTAGLEYNNTYQLSRVAGSTATLSFQGDFVEVYGSIRKKNNPVGTPSPISSYTLEDGSSVTFTPVETDSNHFRSLFFEKRGLTNSNHTLVIKNLVQDDFYFLDYFVVGASGDAPSIGGTTNGASNSSSSSSSSSSINVGAVVGAVVGTMAITLLAVLIGFYCWRRTRRRSKQASMPDEETN